MRQVVLDTETTGLSWERGNRVVEIGCIELVERRPTGQRFQRYLNPDRELEPGAQEVTGLTLEFLSDVHRVLRPGGVLVLNVTDRGPFAYGRRVLAGVLAVFGYVLACAEPSTLKGRRFGNVILVGSGRRLPTDQIAAAAGRVLYPYRVLAGARLTQLLAGAAPFTDAESEQSPLPPRGRAHFS